MKELKIKRIEVDENNRRAGHIKSFVAESEYRYSRRIEAVAERIEQEIDRKSVLLIAGPSASGKTTTALEVSARLALSGINAPVVSLDDFYKSFEQLPLREDGEPDLESVYGLDLAAIERCFARLFRDGRALFPRYDFTTRRSLPDSQEIVTGERDILIIEGIHALNPLITGDLGSDRFLRLYVRTATEFVSGGEVVMSPEDTRKVRRMVRDHYYRATSLERTLDLWSGVMEGELKYIRPYIGEADFALNTTYDYEPNVFHNYLFPLLTEAAALGESRYAGEFVRLREAFNMFLDIPADVVPESSMLREFIPAKNN